MNDTIYDEEHYCSACHGRRIDADDKPCKHCQSTGQEPVNTFESTVHVQIRRTRHNRETAGAGTRTF